MNKIFSCYCWFSPCCPSIACRVVLSGKPPFVKRKNIHFLVEIVLLGPWRFLVLLITEDLWFFGLKFIPVSGEACGAIQVIRSPLKI
jgi:hypothetical protein